MPSHHRRAFRHAVSIPCQIVRERDFRLVADRALDLSTDGMLVPTDLPVLTGEPLLVSFDLSRFQRARPRVWLDAEAVVARVEHGRRPGDRGRRLGIAFQGVASEARQALFGLLRALPPAGGLRGRGQAARRTDG
jgi:PilZ domain